MRLIAPHVPNITNVNDDGTVPQMAAQNWKSYNNFRSGDLSANDGAAAPDLRVVAPMECLNKCTGANMAEIWVQLGNIGAAPLTAGASIEVSGGASRFA